MAETGKTGGPNFPLKQPEDQNTSAEEQRRQQAVLEKVRQKESQVREGQQRELYGNMVKDPGRHSENVRGDQGLHTGSMVGALEGKTVQRPETREQTEGPREAAERTRSPFSARGDTRTPLEIATEVRDPEQKKRDEEAARLRGRKNSISVDYEGLVSVTVDGKPMEVRSGPAIIDFDKEVLIRPLTGEEEMQLVRPQRRADDRGFSDIPTIQADRETRSGPVRGEPAHRGQPTVRGQGAGQVASSGPGGPLSSAPHDPSQGGEKRIGGGPIGGGESAHSTDRNTSPANNPVPNAPAGRKAGDGPENR